MSKEVLVFLGLLFILSYLLEINFIYEHELVHKQIFEYYGINSTIEIDYFKLKGETVPDFNNVDISSEDIDRVYFLHALNEIVGYHMHALMLAIISFLIVICIILA